MKINISYSEFLLPKKIINIHKGIEEGVKVVTQFLYEKFEERLKERYYSLKELQLMDHPYALRHYKGKTFIIININKLLTAKGFAGIPLSIINKQSGNLLSSLRKEIIIKPLYAKGRIYIIKEQAKYAKYVFYGTKYLIARPIHLAILVTYENLIKRMFFTTFKSVYKMSLLKS